MSELFTQEQVREELKRQIDSAGGMRAWCREHGLTHSSVSPVVAALRPVSEVIANECGLFVFASKNLRKSRIRRRCWISTAAQ